MSLGDYISSDSPDGLEEITRVEIKYKNNWLNTDDPTVPEEAFSFSPLRAIREFVKFTEPEKIKPNYMSPVYAYCIQCWV